MTSAKDLRLAPIASRDAIQFVRTHHYSGKVANNSQLHIGAFLNDRLEGVMSFGPPLDKGKLLGLVDGTGWTQMMELNRMVFTDALPRNSESRALGIAFRLLRRHAPQVKWVVSFADATQCGDGTIYRASGFVLTGVKKSANLALLPDGSTIHKMTLESSPSAGRPELGGRSYYDVTGGRYNFAAYCGFVGATVLPGYQMRYIKFVDPTWAPRLTVPIIPFGDIDRIGAGMYKGERVTRADRHTSQTCAGSIEADAPRTPAGRGRFDTDPGAPSQ